jgi:hypothetical protein
MARVIAFHRHRQVRSSRTLARTPRRSSPPVDLCTGGVVEAHKASQLKGQAKLVVKFNELRLASGKTVPITASLVTEGQDTSKRTAGGIAGGAAAAGAILGKIIGKDTKGAAIGAVAGARSAPASSSASDNKDVELPPGTDLVVNVDTELQCRSEGRVARPRTERDPGRGRPSGRGRRSLLGRLEGCQGSRKRVVPP